MGVILSVELLTPDDDNVDDDVEFWTVDDVDDDAFVVVGCVDGSAF